MSFTKGISIHHEVKASTQPTINNNISISASNEIKTEVSESSQRVVYPPSPQSNEPSIIERENEFLRKVLSIYMSQKFYFSGKYLVITSDELLDLIQTLLPDKSIVITNNDIEDVGCCSFKDAPWKKVESIWIGEGEVQQNFKYAYSNLVALFEQYKISIKFVRA